MTNSCVRAVLLLSSYHSTAPAMAAQAVGNLLAGTPLPESAVRWAKGVAERAVTAWVTVASADQSLCENTAFSSHSHTVSEANADDETTAAARRPLLSQNQQQRVGTSTPWRHMTDAEDKKDV